MDVEKWKKLVKKNRKKIDIFFDIYVKKLNCRKN